MLAQDREKDGKVTDSIRKIIEEVSLMTALKNARHEKYVQNLIAGMSQRQAYIEAFPHSKKWKDATVDSKASVLLSGKVLERYNEIQEEQKKEESN